jgi:hypothetical protein
MIYLCMVIEVIQKRIPASTMVMIPGTHPRTLKEHTVSFTYFRYIAMFAGYLRE